MRVEEDSHENFKNWVEQYDLTCADEQKLALIGTLFFAGFSTGAIILPTASDKYGRKPFTIFGVSVTIASIVVMIFSKSYKVLCTLQFLLGFCTVGRYNVGYLLLTEHWNEKDVSKVTAKFLAVDALCMAISSFYFRFISRNWIYLAIGAASL